MNHPCYFLSHYNTIMKHEITGHSWHPMARPSRLQRFILAFTGPTSEDCRIVPSLLQFGMEGLSRGVRGWKFKLKHNWFPLFYTHIHTYLYEYLYIYIQYVYKRIYMCLCTVWICQLFGYGGLSIRLIEDAGMSTAPRDLQTSVLGLPRAPNQWTTEAIYWLP